ncbi:MAG: hypothetical protein ACKOW5_16295 [Actinomycetales bacterium]
MSSTPTDSDLMEAASVSQTGLTSDTVMMQIVSLGALCIAALFVVAVLRGRQAPQRRMVWVVGLLMAGIPAALLTLVAIAAAFSDGGSWLIIGVTGLWLLVGLAITRPWWAGWGFIGSALALPMLLWCCVPKGPAVKHGGDSSSVPELQERC